jgi:Domain of unknown function (DUF4149)
VTRGQSGLVDGTILLVTAAWVGGHTALGAFAARILFRDLPRGVAAPTMTTIFRSFDKVIAVCLGVLAAASLLRAWGQGLGQRSDRFVAGASVALCAIGAFELLWLHPSIESMFEAGRTLEPSFASLHRISERCAHLEVIAAVTLFLAMAYSRPTTS